jgi:hypothetical protein
MLIRQRTKSSHVTPLIPNLNEVTEIEFKEILINLIKSCLKWNELDFNVTYNDLILSFPKIKNDSLIVRTRLRSLLLDQKYETGIKYFDNTISQKCPELKMDKYVCIIVGLLYYHLDKFDNAIFYINQSKRYENVSVISPNEFFTEKDYNDYNLKDLINIDSEEELILKVIEIECYGYKNSKYVNVLIAQFNYYIVKGLYLVRQGKRDAGEKCLKEAMIISGEKRGMSKIMLSKIRSDEIIKSVCDLEQTYNTIFINIQTLDKKDPNNLKFITKITNLSNKGLIVIDKALFNYSADDKYNRNMITEINELSNEFYKLQSEINSLKTKNDNEEMIDINLIKNLDDLRNSIKYLKEENVKYYRYAKSLYWTLLNYFMVYKKLCERLGTDKKEINKEKLIEAGMLEAAEIIFYLVINTPILPSLIKYIEDIIDSKFPTLKEKSFEERVLTFEDAYSLCFKDENSIEYDISLNLGILALSVSINKVKQLEIDKESVWSQGQEFINKLKMSGINMYDGCGTTSVKDSILLLVYLYKHSEEIQKSKKDIYEEMKEILLDGRLNVYIPNNKQAETERTKCTCCYII